MRIDSHVIYVHLICFQNSKLPFRHRQQTIAHVKLYYSQQYDIIVPAADTDRTASDSNVLHSTTDFEV